MKITLTFTICYILINTNLAFSQSTWQIDMGLEDFSYATYKDQGLMRIVTSMDTVIIFDLYNREVLSKFYLKGAKVHGKFTWEKKYPFVWVKGLPTEKLLVTRDVLVEYYSGYIIYDSQEMNTNPDADKFFVLDANAVFEKGKQNKELVFAYGEFGDDSLQWVKRVPVELKRFTLRDNIWLEPIFNKDYCVVGYAGKLFGLERKSGEVLWEKEVNQYNTDKIFQKPEHIRLSDPFFYAVENKDNSKQLMAYDMSTGNTTWEEPITVKHYKILSKKYENGLLLGISNQINLYSWSTGKALWPNALETDYRSYYSQKKQDELLLYIGYLERDKNAEGVLTKRRFNMISDNKVKWDSSIVLNGKQIDFFHPYRDKGYAFLTNKQAGFINPKGAIITQFPISETHPFQWDYDQDKNTMLLYQDKSLTVLDYNRQTVKTTKLGLKLNGNKDEEFINRIWTSDSGYLFASKRNLILLDTSLQQVYHQYYPDYKMSAATKQKLLSAGAFAVGSLLSDEVLDIYNSVSELGLIGYQDNWDDAYAYYTLGKSAGMGLITAKYVNRMIQFQNDLGKASSLNNYWLLDDKLNDDQYGLRLIDVNSGEQTASIPLSSNKTFYYTIIPSLNGLTYWQGDVLHFYGFE